MEDRGGDWRWRIGDAGVEKPPCCLGGKYREDLLDKKGNGYCKGGAEVTLKKI